VDNKNQNRCFDFCILKKTRQMKKPPKIPRPKTEPLVEPGMHADEIFKGLEIAERTRNPPSEELISRLNQLASKPPFSYTQKDRENDPH
jgi:hypothetical protein